MTEHESAPTVRDRFKELLIDRFGIGGCRHDYRILPVRGAFRVRCARCGLESEPFRIASETHGETK